MSNRKVLLAMTNGIHSAVAAILLQEQNFEVFGLHLKIDCPANPHCASTEAERAQIESIAKKLGITLKIVDVSDYYEATVFDPAVEARLINRPIHSCRLCTKSVLIGTLESVAGELGCDSIATGHRVQIQYESATNRYTLLRGLDLQNDQSDLFFGLSQETMSKMMFPVGALTEAQITKLAYSFELEFPKSGPSERFESRDCIRDPLKDPEFYRTRYAADVVPTAIVQEPGGSKLEVEALKPPYELGDRFFVQHTSSKEKKEYAVVSFSIRPHLVLVDDPEKLLRTKVYLKDVEWTHRVDQSQFISLGVRLLGTKEVLAAKLEACAADRAWLTLPEAKDGFYPGRSVVFYRQNEVIGGGTITEPLATLPAVAR